MPVSPFSSTGEPFRLPAVSDHERQPYLVERITDGLRDHSRVILDAATDRDRQRTVAAGKVAGKHLKRATRATVTSRGVLVEFDDLDDSYQQFQDEQEQWRARPRPTSSEAAPPVEQSVHHPPEGQLPRRIPGAGPRPGAPGPGRR